MDGAAHDTYDVIYRNYSDADFDRLRELLLSTPETARYPEEVSVESLQSQLAWPGHIPERDRWIAFEREDSNVLIGYSAIFKSPETPRADCLVIVRPEYRRQGIGTRMLHQIVEDGRALGAHHVAGYVNDLDVEAAGFAQRHGCEAVGAYTRLRADSVIRIESASWPTGYTLRAWKGDHDLATLVDASNQCYEGLWGHNTASVEMWRHWLPSMDTRGIMILFDEWSAVAGVVRAEPVTVDGRISGRIDAPGVTPRLRKDDVYRQLLLCAIAWLTTQGASEYEIESWGDNPSVLEAYRSLGFKTIRRETMYAVALDDIRA